MKIEYEKIEYHLHPFSVLFWFCWWCWGEGGGVLKWFSLVTEKDAADIKF